MITKPCAHRGPVPTFVPCTRASKPYPNSSVGMLHISAQRVPYFGTKCERCIYFTFPRATEKIGHVYRHAGYLFHWYWIPILIKQNSFLCRYKNWSFLVFCIRRQTDIFRFILIYLIIYCILCSGRKKEKAFVRTNCWNWSAFESWQRGRSGWDSVTCESR